MGGATLRFITLLSSPLPLLHPSRPSYLLLLRRLASPRSSLFLSPFLPLPLSPLLPPLKCSQQLHSQAHPIWDEIPSVHSSGRCSVSSTDIHHHQHPWPEFSDFVDWVSFSGYCNAPLDVLQFVGAQELSEQFLKDANSCLAFARDHPTLLWSIPREDVEVVVEHGSPFLFKNGLAAAARMKSFLRDGCNVLKSDEPSTVDLMEFLLSYAHLAVGLQENMQIYNRVESSVRKLFSALAKSKGSYVESVATVQKEFSETHRQAPRSFDKGVEMKKGDWICPRCSFMNFAKNSHCLQCEEHRPKKFITGGEWECPQCDFYNFSRNVVCLRCDCKKPEINLFMNPTSVSGLRADTSVKGNTEERVAGTEVEQRWFTKISQLENSSDMSSDPADEDLPETLRNSGFINNPDRSSPRTAGNENSINMEISQSLDELIGEKSSYINNNKGGDFVKNSRASSLSAMSSSASSQYGKYSEQKSGLETDALVEQQISEEMFSNQMENKDYEREQAEKSERWFKKLHDVKDLPSAKSDDNFPETMPMREGENRFVVSKKKDRSLTSPMYKRRAAMEQAGNTKHVPFVPFPPGYFAKEKQKEGSESTHSSEQTGAISSDSREASNSVDQNIKSFDFQSNSCDEHSEAQSTESWRGKSLEGSPVKDPDPLDMSEEAKAERWFRRVAQIKDISELSQIPDEDFPSIMPMRKGVNRFVVSKRKSPLERRLTSSQYRRNLPAVSSDPTWYETDPK